MSVELLAFPIAIDETTGDFVTVTQGTDAETADVIATMVHTRKGEIPGDPGFGTSDPAYVTPPELVGEIQACLALFGPQVAVSAGDISIDTAGISLTVPVFYGPQEPQEDA